MDGRRKFQSVNHTAPMPSTQSSFILASCHPVSQDFITPLLARPATHLSRRGEGARAQCRAQRHIRPLLGVRVCVVQGLPLFPIFSRPARFQHPAAARASSDARGLSAPAKRSRRPPARPASSPRCWRAGSHGQPGASSPRRAEYSRRPGPSIARHQRTPHRNDTVDDVCPPLPRIAAGLRNPCLDPQAFWQAHPRLRMPRISQHAHRDTPACLPELCIETGKSETNTPAAAQNEAARVIALLAARLC
jgi:hypothetical protein